MYCTNEPRFFSAEFFPIPSPCCRLVISQSVDCNGRLNGRCSIASYLVATDSSTVDARATGPPTPSQLAHGYGSITSRLATRDSRQFLLVGTSQPELSQGQGPAQPEPASTMQQPGKNENEGLSLFTLVARHHSFFKCFHVRCALGVEGGHLSEGLRASQVLLVFDCWLPGQQRSAAQRSAGEQVHKASRERYPNPLLHRIASYPRASRRVASHRIISAPGLTKTHCPTDRSHGVCRRRRRRWRWETVSQQPNGMAPLVS
ncbi:hypothetical protein IWZ01DRAFT_356616 [Phyllosticta capitalensis]